MFPTTRTRIDMSAILSSSPHPSPHEKGIEGVGKRRLRTRFSIAVLSLACVIPAVALEPIAVEGQPLAANVKRIAEAMEMLGHPLPANLSKSLATTIASRDAMAIQRQLDSFVLLQIHINPEARVKVQRGPAKAELQQDDYTPVIVKIVNESTGTQRLRIRSPQAGAPYAGVAPLSMKRQQQQPLTANENKSRSSERFLDVGMFTNPPMTESLSGLKIEYAIALIYSSEAGQREATIGFDIGQGTEDLGFRGETAVLFTVKPAIPVKFRVEDFDGTPTVGRFQFTDANGRVYPSQARRLAPDFFFQKHIYRGDGETVSLPPGEFTMHHGRGPEYKWQSRRITVSETTPNPVISVKLQRWIHPREYGFYSGDHHIHASGCAHYTYPTVGMSPADMFRQVKGEGLNVGCVLTWGPGFDHQQQYFSPEADRVSEPTTLLKYDVEVSGFGSQALGHVCLLNLKEQIYPGASGSRNWPTWTVPVMRWAKAQQAVVGYAHSGSGLQIEPAAAAKRMLSALDSNQDGALNRAEAGAGLLTEPFNSVDGSRDGLLNLSELTTSHDRVADQLPNLAIPELNGVGAQEIFVTAALGLCDFISAMDTARISEWNCWYHLLNCGLPVRVSGETDFPCMSGTRVGQGRVYVQLGVRNKLDFTEWSEGIRAGNSYVSDGYGHALAFSVNGNASGSALRLDNPSAVNVSARVAFSPETPLEVYYGSKTPLSGARLSGDTIDIHPSKSTDNYQGNRTVELVVNGQVKASRTIPADGEIHDLKFNVRIDRSSWVALRQFPQLHTNPVNVLIADKPIRALRKSAEWCLGCIDQLWRVRGTRIAPKERKGAERTYQQVREIYQRIATEARAGT